MNIIDLQKPLPNGCRVIGKRLSLRRGPSLEELMLDLPLELRFMIYENLVDDQGGSYSLYNFPFEEGSTIFVKSLAKFSGLDIVLDDRDGGKTSQIALEARNVLCKKIGFSMPIKSVPDFVKLCEGAAVITSIRDVEVLMVNRSKNPDSRRFKSSHLRAILEMPNLKRLCCHIEFRDDDWYRDRDYAHTPEASLPKALRIFKTQLRSALRETGTSTALIKKSYVRLGICRHHGTLNGRLGMGYAQTFRKLPLFDFLPEEEKKALTGSSSSPK